VSAADRSPAWLVAAAGALGSIAVGFAVFRSGMLHPASPSFQCVSVGILTAGMVAAVRARRARWTLAWPLPFALVTASPVMVQGTSAALLVGTRSFLLAWGLLLVAVIYDGLCEAGYRLGKFVVTGAALAGIYAALTPFVLLSGLRRGEVLTTLAFNALIGFLIGDGVGFGAETAEWLARRRPAPQNPPAVDGVD
jgi:hypothetical protein